MDRPAVSLGAILRRNGVWLLALPLALAVAFGLAGWVALTAQGSQIWRGIEGTADVTALRTGVRASGGDRVQTAFVEYEWTGIDGAPRTGSVEVTPDRQAAFRVGDAIPVLLDPRDPTAHEILPHRPAGLASALLGAAVLSVGLAGFMARRIVAPGLAEYRACTRGRRLDATVISHEALRHHVAGLPQMRLHWRDDDGQLGASGALPQSCAQDWPQRARLSVCRDPKSGAAFWCNESVVRHAAYARRPPQEG